MILELVDIRIRPGHTGAFDEAIERGVRDVIADAKGFRGFSVNKGVESPDRYILQIFWDSIDDHMVGFRQSDAFTRWRTVVGSYFAREPVMEHFELLCEADGPRARLEIEMR